VNQSTTTKKLSCTISLTGFDINIRHFLDKHNIVNISIFLNCTFATRFIGLPLFFYVGSPQLGGGDSQFPMIRSNVGFLSFPDIDYRPKDKMLLFYNHSCAHSRLNGSSKFRRKSGEFIYETPFRLGTGVEPPSKMSAASHTTSSAPELSLSIIHQSRQINRGYIDKMFNMAIFFNNFCCLSLKIPHFKQSPAI
jgi:hypothetical protein